MSIPAHQEDISDHLIKIQLIAMVVGWLLVCVLKFIENVIKIRFLVPLWFAGVLYYVYYCGFKLPLSQALPSDSVLTYCLYQLGLLVGWAILTALIIIVPAMSWIKGGSSQHIGPNEFYVVQEGPLREEFIFRFLPFLLTTILCNLILSSSLRTNASDALASALIVTPLIAPAIVWLVSSLIFAFFHRPQSSKQGFDFYYELIKAGLSLGTPMVVLGILWPVILVSFSVDGAAAWPFFAKHFLLALSCAFIMCFFLHSFHNKSVVEHEYGDGSRERARKGFDICKELEIILYKNGVEAEKDDLVIYYAVIMSLPNRGNLVQRLKSAMDDLAVCLSQPSGSPSKRELLTLMDKVIQRVKSRRFENTRNNRYYRERSPLGGMGPAQFEEDLVALTMECSSNRDLRRIAELLNAAKTLGQ